MVGSSDQATSGFHDRGGPRKDPTQPYRGERSRSSAPWQELQLATFNHAVVSSELERKRITSSAAEAQRMVSLVREGESFFRPDQPVLCPLLGVEVPIWVYTDGMEVHPDQSDALSRFLAIEPGQRAALLEPLFADYREVIEAIGEGPEIAGPERVWGFIRWTEIVVPRQGEGSRFVFVQGDPAWEEEHGVELLFRDEQLVRLDRASGVAMTTCFWSWRRRADAETVAAPDRRGISVFRYR